ncbi:MAG: hypothetical protein H7067_14195 [Burkholderiales bacterium]|nr:hypothetical protein [Opitutaceae bacterium]
MALALPPAAPSTKRSAEYSATLNGEAVFVHGLPGFAGGTVSFVSVDLDAASEAALTAGRALEFRVTAHRLVDQVSVRPLSAGVASTLENETTAVFKITRPGHYFVKWDDSFQLPFYLFVNPPCVAPAEPPPPPPGSRLRPALISFGPGIHKPGLIRLRSGQTLYFAPGAEVHGTVIAEDASDIRICGRGILKGSSIPFGGTAEHRHMIGLHRCKRVIVEGVTVIDGFGWNIIAHHCDDVVFRWVKVLTERLWSTDGINPCASRHVLIEDCFIRSKDDCVAVKGLDWEHPDPSDWRPMHDITVRRIVGWSDNNNAFVVGAETRCSEISRIRFEDCDLLHVSNTCGDEAAALTITALDDTRLHDVVFRDIRVEFNHGPLINVYLTNDVFDIPGTRLPAGGVIEDIEFTDITLLEGPSRRSFLRGLDDTRLVRGIRFKNLTVRGVPVRDAAALRLVTNAHVRDVTFA